MCPMHSKLLRDFKLKPGVQKMIRVNGPIILSGDLGIHMALCQAPSTWSMWFINRHELSVISFAHMLQWKRGWTSVWNISHSNGNGRRLAYDVWNIIFLNGWVLLCILGYWTFCMYSILYLPFPPKYRAATQYKDRLSKVWVFLF